MRDAKHELFDVVLTKDVDRISRDKVDFHDARRLLKLLGIELHAAHGIVG
jgi:DNA invertase Pin-like site-specific DNA recombinase